MPLFQYQADPYPNTATIADLILRANAPRAQALLARGDRNAQAVQSIGALIGAIPQQMAAEQAQAQERTMRALQIANAQHEQDLQPVRDALAARQIAEEQAKALEGRPAADLSPFGKVVIPTAPPDTLAEGITLPNVNASETVTGRPMPVQVPGVPATRTTPAIPGYSQTPRSAEDLAAQAINAELAKAMTTPQKVGPEDSVVIPMLGNQPIAQNTTPKPPASDQERFMSKFAEGKLGAGKTWRDLSPADYNEGLRQYNESTKAAPGLEEQYLTATAKGDTAGAQRILGTLRATAAAKRDPAQQALADELGKLRKDEAQARLEALQKKNAPVDVSADVQTTTSGKKYVDLSSFTTEERDRVRDAATQAGAVVVGKDQASALQEIDNARLNQRTIQAGILGKLPHDAAGRITTGAGNVIGKYLQTDDYLAAIGSLRTAAIQSLRAAAGSKGLRINEAEIALAVENDLPKLTDTAGTAVQKFKNLMAQLDNAESSILVRDRSALQPSTGASAPAEGTEGVVNGTAAVWKTVNGKAGWYAK